jgi:hypothetical protein
LPAADVGVTATRVLRKNKVIIVNFKTALRLILTLLSEYQFRHDIPRAGIFATSEAAAAGCSQRG